MFAGAYIGLAVTSHNANAMATAQFSNIAVTGAGRAHGRFRRLAVQRTNDPAPLYATVQDSAGKSKTISHPVPAATNLSTWQEWRIPLSEFASGGVKTTAVKKLVIGVGDRTTPRNRAAPACCISTTSASGIPLRRDMELRVCFSTDYPRAGYPAKGRGNSFRRCCPVRWPEFRTGTREATCLRFDVLEN